MGAREERREERLSADQVADYLRRHPAFLLDHADLLETLLPPTRSQGERVADMQQFMLQKLQSRLAHLRDAQSALLAAGRSNLTAQTQIHAAVLALLAAGSFAHLIHIITHDFSTILDVDVVVLLIEETKAIEPHAAGHNLYVVRKGAVDRLIGTGRDILLRERSKNTDDVYGPAAALVRSDALARLSFAPSAPSGLLALGSRSPDKFHAGQATELLQFLAQAVAGSVGAWLDLGPA